MADVKVGDQVFDIDGNLCNVVEVHPVWFDRPCYKLGFSDGSEIIADEEHLWLTHEKPYRKSLGRRTCRPSNKPQCQISTFPSVVSTRQIKDTLIYRKEANHAVPLCRPLILPELNLELDPYILGYWLGDGTSASGEITCADHASLRHQLETRGFSFYTRDNHSGDDRPEAALKYRVQEGPDGLRLTEKLRQLNLLNNKHIPKTYLRASFEQRAELLRGLLDSDGFCNKNGNSIEYCTIMSNLADDVFELAASLGLQPVMTKSDAKLYGRKVSDRYRIVFNPSCDFPLFHIPRKLERQMGRKTRDRRVGYRYITSVEPVPSVPVRCISVDSPSRTFLCGKSMIPTHNTRTGAETVKMWSLLEPGMHVAVVAPTFGDLRDIIFENVDSGLLAVIPKECMKTGDIEGSYFASLGKLYLANGSMITGLSSDNTDRFRGRQFHKVWADEVASWKDPEDAMRILSAAVRLPSKGGPQFVFTTTPRPMNFFVDLMKKPRTVITTGSTFDNAANLAKDFVETLKEDYGDTSFARQELYGELIMDVNGALWARAMFEKPGFRCEPPKKFKYIAIGVDPAVTNNRNSDETGIIVAGLGEDKHVYVLHDASGKYSPERWAIKTMQLCEQYGATKIVVEVNQGGDLVEQILRQHNSMVPIKKERAAVGKVARAEPVSMKYEQGLVHHCGSAKAFETLEDQMCQFSDKTLSSKKSPDRVDALVWVLSHLFQVSKRGNVDPGSWSCDMVQQSYWAQDYNALPDLTKGSK